jgi:hypothetical protein
MQDFIQTAWAPDGAREMSPPDRRREAGRPSFTQLSAAVPGFEQHGLLFVNGYLTCDADRSRWLQGFRELGWRGNIFLLDWDTGGQCLPHFRGAMLGTAVGVEVLSWGLLLVPGIGSLIATSRAARWGFRAAKAVTYASTLGYGLHDHWQQHNQVAQREGLRLGAFLAEQRPAWGAKELHLVGMSLGSKIIYEALRVAAGNPTPAPVADHVVLLAGALSAARSWSTPMRAVSGKIHNLYSRRDGVLKYGFVAAEGDVPIGLAPIEPDPNVGESPTGTELRTRIENIDVSHLIRAHADYEELLGRLPLNFEMSDPAPTKLLLGPARVQ